MHKGSIGVAPEGLPFLFLLGLTALVCALVGCRPGAVIFLAATWFVGHFFRDPERVTPDDPDAAICPADGRIVSVERAPDPIDGEARVRVAVFMNLFDVHVNRSPVAGRVEAVRYFPGTFVNASLDKASTDNERCALRLRDEEDRSWVVVQIAGLVARRIVCRAKTGDALERGERFGMIRFGSRVDLYLPDAYSPVVAVGDVVKAGETVLARRRES